MLLRDNLALVKVIIRIDITIHTSNLMILPIKVIDM
jgi:hypothetical protein